MVEALCKELILRKDESTGSELQTVYFGGGTPSILTQGELQQLFETIYQHYKVSPEAEITLEANPDDFFKGHAPQEYLQTLKNLSVNRLSLGVQSFYEKDLRLMNRVHNTEQVAVLLPLVAKHFDNFTIDLIYGIPKMSTARWEANLRKALSFGVPHISAYALTVEERTALHSLIVKGKCPPVEDELALAHFQLMIDLLEAEGYIQYEFSNFGKEGYFSRNNTAYWFGKPYMGIGPSAHSFNGKERRWNIAHNIKYIQALQKEKLPFEKEELTLNNQYNELIITRIRTMVGIDLREVYTTFGEPYHAYLLQQASKYLYDGFLHIEDNHLKVTKAGKFLSDGIAADLFKVD